MYSGVVLEFLNMGGGEIALIMVAVLLLFGGKKLPELARGLGKGIREFKDASEGVKREIHRNINAVDIENELKDEEKVNEPNADVEENHAERHHPSSDNDNEPFQANTTNEEPVPAKKIVLEKKSKPKKNKETEV